MIAQDMTPPIFVSDSDFIAITKDSTLCNEQGHLGPKEFENVMREQIRLYTQQRLSSTSEFWAVSDEDFTELASIKQILLELLGARAEQEKASRQLEDILARLPERDYHFSREQVSRRKDSLISQAEPCCVNWPASIGTMNCERKCMFDEVTARIDEAGAAKWTREEFDTSDSNTCKGGDAGMLPEQISDQSSRSLMQDSLKNAEQPDNVNLTRRKLLRVFDDVELEWSGVLEGADAPNLIVAETDLTKLLPDISSFGTTLLDQLAVGPAEQRTLSSASGLGPPLRGREEVSINCDGVNNYEDFPPACGPSPSRALLTSNLQRARPRQFLANDSSCNLCCEQEGRLSGGPIVDDQSNGLATNSDVVAFPQTRWSSNTAVESTTTDKKIGQACLQSDLGIDNSSNVRDFRQPLREAGNTNIVDHSRLLTANLTISLVDSETKHITARTSGLQSEGKIDGTEPRDRSFDPEITMRPTEETNMKEIVFSSRVNAQVDLRACSRNAGQHIKPSVRGSQESKLRPSPHSWSESLDSLPSTKRSHNIRRNASDVFP